MNFCNECKYYRKGGYCANRDMTVYYIKKLMNSEDYKGVPTHLMVDQLPSCFYVREEQMKEGVENCPGFREGFSMRGLLS